MDRVDCNVVRDLLPLYVDDVLSVESCALVEAHVGDCVPCRQQLEKLRAKGIEIPNAGAEMSAGQALRALNRSIKRKTKRGILVGLLVAVALYFGAFVVNDLLFVRNDTPIGASGISDYMLAKISTGQMVFAIDVSKSTRRQGCRYTEFVEEDSGKAMYITPVRPLFDRPFGGDDGVFDSPMEDVDFMNVVFRDGSAFIEPDVDELDEGSMKISRIYLGTQQDALLIWKSGDEVPPAEDWIEQKYRDQMDARI